MTHHLNTVLLTLFLVYGYRNLWPLATYTRTPSDGEGVEVWIKMVCLILAAVILPMFAPRQYIPVDPEVGHESLSMFRIVLTLLRISLSQN